MPLRGVRHKIAEHMSEAAAVPTVTVVEECDFSALSGAPTPYARAAAIIAATAGALSAHPDLNATLERGELVRQERLDLGYAVQGAHGLVVPVVRDAGWRPADQIAEEVERLVEAARAGTLTPEELRGGTFTLTDARRLGGLFATPLLNTPQVAILGVHRVAERPVVRDGEIVARPWGCSRSVSITVPWMGPLPPPSYSTSSTASRGGQSADELLGGLRTVALRRSTSLPRSSAA